MPEYLHPGVYVQEESSGAKPIEGASTSTACIVGTATRGRPNRPTFVSSWSQFERAFGGFSKAHPMPLAAYHFFQNGGRRAYILRVLAKDAVAAAGELSIEGIAVPLKIKAAGGGTWANDIKIEVTRNPYGRDPKDSKDERQDLFDWVISGKNAEGREVELERFGSLGIKESGDKFYASVINRDSSYIRIEPDETGNFPEATPRAAAGGESGTPGTGTPGTGTPGTGTPGTGTPGTGTPGTGTPGTTPAASEAAAAVSATLGGGTDGTAITANDYEASLRELDRIDDVSILVIPGASAEVAEKGVAYVEGRLLGDIIYIVDPPDPPGNTEPSTQIENIKAFVKGFSRKSSYAALYFPWVVISDPYSNVSGATRLAPPSGMIAGLYARTDNTRGVWKAPAGTEAGLLGAIGVAAPISDGDQDALNPIGVNCIRQFPASGIVVWGARTMATSSNPEYRYVPVRRMTMFLKTSLYRGTQWVVFEPNDEPVWSAIRFNINAFMLTQFRAGAFQGGKPADAFYVKCDADNNPQATIDAGQVHILVAFAPLKPAEFVIIHIQQIRKQ
ncbi:phage tail sheath family protein [Sorangium sp. So ce861]|uniref:phage tail sheath family protein n=1 Tax=Sorangium sp. So ce861 TaxID=3133323 RepID=UPI003F642AB0